MTDRFNGFQAVVKTHVLKSGAVLMILIYLSEAFVKYRNSMHLVTEMGRT